MDGLLAGVPMAGTVLILGLFFGFVYKRPIFDWLNRVKQVKAGDTTIDMSAQAVEQQAANSTITTGSSGSLAAAPAALPAATAPSTNITISPGPAPNAARAEELRNFGTPAVLLEREAEIRRDLLNVPEHERDRTLIRHLAVAQIEWRAEEVYRLIFGSQIAILQHLNLYTSDSEQHLIELFFDTTAAQYPDAYAKMDRGQYFQYLVGAKLVNRSEQGIYTLTVFGKAFLEWMPYKGILPNKPY